jgi:hypothetical protein
MTVCIGFSQDWLRVRQRALRCSRESVRFADASEQGLRRLGVSTVKSSEYAVFGEQTRFGAEDCQRGVRIRLSVQKG